MNASTRPSFRVIACGVIALASAMGIGRFAFTPLLPLMLRDGTLAPAAGAEWAAANYLGYLIGALTAGGFARHAAWGLRLALVGVALATLPMALVGAEAPPLLGAALRAAAGVFSAWALVCASSWCLAELARRQAASLGAWIYTGVGLGIALAGLLAWLGGRQPAATLWLELGLAALAGAAFVALALPGEGAATPATKRPAGRGGGHWGLVLCYGCFGFGYILPATFLPAMARQQVANPLVFGLTWPLFGLAAALSVALAARWLGGWPRRRVWAVAQGVMAVGAALPIGSQALPVLVRAVGPGWGGWDAMACAHAVAALVLAASAAWLWRPKRPVSGRIGGG